MTHDPSRPPEAVTPVLPAAPRSQAAPTEPDALATDAGPAPTHAVAFGERTHAPNRLRAGVVAGAAIALAVGAVATSFAASPGATATGTDGNGATGTVTTSAWAPPAAMSGLLDGQAGVFEHGRLGGHGGFRDITISAIDGSSLSLETSDGWTRTVTVSDGVELTKGGQAIELSDLVVGDEIRLRQEITDDGTITVTGIAVVVPSVAGEVSDLSATGFKLTGRDGAVWTIAVTNDTTYRYGAGEGSLADIEDGDVVHVQGTSTGDNALTATSVAVRGDMAAGTVTATSADSITIEDRDGDRVTIHVDADTTYRSPGVDDASLADIAVDDVIAVSGRTRSDGSIDAAAVMEGGRFERPGFDGPDFGGGRGGHGPGFPGGPGLPGNADDDGDSPTDAG